MHTTTTYTQYTDTATSHTYTMHRQTQPLWWPIHNTTMVVKKKKLLLQKKPNRDKKILQGRKTTNHIQHIYCNKSTSGKISCLSSICLILCLWNHLHTGNSQDTTTTQQQKQPVACTISVDWSLPPVPPF